MKHSISTACSSHPQLMVRGDESHMRWVPCTRRGPHFQHPLTHHKDFEISVGHSSSTSAFPLRETIDSITSDLGASKPRMDS